MPDEEDDGVDVEDDDSGDDDSEDKLLEDEVDDVELVVWLVWDDGNVDGP